MMIGTRWKPLDFQMHKLLCILLFFNLQISDCSSLNLEGLALLEFRAKVEADPHGVFENWNPQDNDPCSWSGVHCINGKVEILNLSGWSLSGVLSPELGKLGHLRALVLNKNNFSGVIPKEIGELNMLELLDLRRNNLSEPIPTEISKLLSLKHLLLCGNWVDGDLHSELEDFDMCSKIQSDKNLPFEVKHQHNRINRKVSLLSKFMKGYPHGHENRYGDALETVQNSIKMKEHLANYNFRRLLQETSNLPADSIVVPSIQEFVNVPSSGSGSFPAISNANGSRKPSLTPPIQPSNPLFHDSPPTQLPIDGGSTKPVSFREQQSTFCKGLGKWIYILLGVAGIVLLIFIAHMLLVGRSHGAATIGPWRTGISGQLQKAFVSGVPKLNREELEAACEDFSNIIQSFPEFTVFKGTLSSGVEIAVASTVISYSKDWSKRSEALFRKKIDTLSRINHKNFVNLLGYCEEEDPFIRTLVFEYAPNGTLYEHLHVKELEHLDWGVRMRIIMGITYCLQYMHHELHPPVCHPNLQSSSIYLTDDYAVKIVEMGIWKEVARGKKISGEDEMDISEIPTSDPGSNVYDFGVLLLEIISGRPSYSEEQGSIVDWAAEYLNDKSSFKNMIDPTMKFSKQSELDTICEVINECVHLDPKKRPTMKEVTSELREVLGISPDSATPRLSPLWWAELEILSVEAT